MEPKQKKRKCRIDHVPPYKRWKRAFIDGQEGTMFILFQEVEPDIKQDFLNRFDNVKWFKVKPEGFGESYLQALFVGDNCF